MIILKFGLMTWYKYEWDMIEKVACFMVKYWLKYIILALSLYINVIS